MAERRTRSGLVVPGASGPDPFFQAFIRRTAGAGPALIALAERDREELRERWQDEASEAALEKDPARAHYIEDWIRRV